jgi:hypothetical protein
MIGREKTRRRRQIVTSEAGIVQNPVPRTSHGIRGNPLIHSRHSHSAKDQSSAGKSYLVGWDAAIRRKRRQVLAIIGDYRKNCVESRQLLAIVLLSSRRSHRFGRGADKLEIVSIEDGI